MGPRRHTDMNRGIAIGIVVALLVAACTTSDPSGTSPTTSPDGSGPTGQRVLAPTEGTERADPVPDAPVDELAAGFNDAGFAFMRTRPVAEELVFSPVSIGHALLMARGAADDPTGAAIDEAFGLPEGLAAHEAWNAIDTAIAASADAEDEVTVTITDRIWPRIDVEPDQDWIDLLVEQHGAIVRALDFAADPEGSRRTINDAVADDTEGLIDDLLPAGSIGPPTVLVLTDAIYFEAPWQRKFGKYDAVTGGFTRLDGTTVDTEYLRELELSDRRGEGDGFVGAEIPYAGSDFSMLVIVPDEDRFEEVRGRLGQELLDEIDATFTTGPYELLVPPWESNTQVGLMPWLGDLGIAPGTYPGIAPGVFIGEAVHGADITVDEWGTVAAAATGLVFLESGPPEPELTVHAERPFFYLIRHRPTGTILFAGQVMDPTA